VTPKHLDLQALGVQLVSGPDGAVTGLRGPRAAAAEVAAEIAARAAVLQAQIPPRGAVGVLALPGVGPEPLGSLDGAVRGEHQHCITCGVDLGTPTRARCALCVAAVHKALRAARMGAAA
jgi:hypothetical protein